MQSIESLAVDKLLLVAQFALLILLLGGAALAIALSAGLADPPTAGKLLMTIPALQLTLPPNQQIQQSLALPASLLPPYTLILTGQFDTPRDPDAQWGIQLCPTDDQADCDEMGMRLLLTSDGFFNLSPFAPDTTRFIHLKGDDQPNEIYLNVEANGHATLRLNREIAWEGQFPSPSEPATINLVGKGGKSVSSSIRLLHGSLYTAS